MALVHLGLNDSAAATESYKQAVRSAAANAETFHQLARQLCAAGLPEADRMLALWAARQAIAQIPLGCYWETLAEVLDRSGDRFGAVAAAREAVREDPDDMGRLSRLLELLLKAMRSRRATDNEAVDIGAMPLDVSPRASKTGPSENLDSGINLLAPGVGVGTLTGVREELIGRAQGGAKQGEAVEFLRRVGQIVHRDAHFAGR